MQKHCRDLRPRTARGVDCVLIALLALAPIAAAEYPSPATAGFHHCALIYDRGQRAAADLAPYVAEMVNGTPRAWLFDAFLFLMSQTPSGLSTTQGATRQADWQYHLDRWFGPDRDLAALDAAIADAASVLGTPAERRRIMLSIPHPDHGVRDFGDVDGDGQSEDLSTETGLRTVLTWYVVQARQRFENAGFTHLELWGFYWMHETIPPADEGLTRAAAKAVHDAGYALLWIPWFKAEGWDRWQAVGIDVAIMQPNYAFFSLHGGSIRRDRLRFNAHLARTHGMGVEIELPMACNDPAAAFYLRRYLAAGAAKRYDYQQAATAYYLGRDNLERLCMSNETWQRDLYTALAAYVHGETVPDPDPICAWGDRGQELPGLQDGDLQQPTATIHAATERPTATWLEAVDVTLAATQPSWTGRIVAEVRDTAEDAWAPAGWALCTGSKENPETPGLITVPVQAVARQVCLTFDPAAEAGPCPVCELVIDGCPPLQTTHSIPSKALNAAYSVAPTLGEATYGDSGHELTDGVVPETGFETGDSIGWQSVNVTVAFDLGRAVTLDRAEVHVEGGGYAAVNWPAASTLLGSLSSMPPADLTGTGPPPDGLTWLAGSPVMIDVQRTTNAANGHLVFQPEKPFRARYLSFNLEAQGWLMLSEIMVSADGRNIVQGADYTLRPTPSLGASEGYPDDGVRLTDGHIAESFNRAQLTGWADDRPRTFTVQLPTREEIKTVTVWTLAGGTYGIRAPDRVHAEASTDGKVWHDIGTRHRPEGLEEHEGLELRALPYRIQTQSPQALAIRVTVIQSTGWCMLSEIQVE